MSSTPLVFSMTVLAFVPITTGQRLVSVPSSQGGIVVLVDAKEKERVNRCQLLVELDDTSARNVVRERMANVAAGHAALELAEARRDVADSRYMRALAFAARPGVPAAIVAETLANAQASLQACEDEIIKATEIVTQSETELREAQFILERHRIVSPANGVIETVHVKKGEAVATGETIVVLLTGK